jgi:hypothetical protein
MMDWANPWVWWDNPSCIHGFIFALALPHGGGPWIDLHTSTKVYERELEKNTTYKTMDGFAFVARGWAPYTNCKSNSESVTIIALRLDNFLLTGHHVVWTEHKDINPSMVLYFSSFLT